MNLSIQKGNSCIRPGLVFICRSCIKVDKTVIVRVNTYNLHVSQSSNNLSKNYNSQYNINEPIKDPNKIDTR